MRAQLSEMWEKSAALFPLRVLRWLTRFPGIGAILGTLIIFSVFSGLSGGKFVKVDTIASILALASETGMVVLGLVVALCAGVIDLSVGSVYAAAALFWVDLSQRVGFAPWILIFAMLAGAAGCGAINGLITTKYNVPAMIVTLGMMFVLRGSLYLATGGFPRSFGTYQNVVFDILAGRIGGSQFRYSIFWLAAIIIILYIIIYHTRFGNHLLASGGNPEFARLMGVDVGRVQTVAFILSSTLAAFGGIISASRFRMVAVTHGEGLELVAVAAAVMGGTLLTGGFTSLLGVVAGILLVSGIRTGLLLVGVPGHWYIVFIGLVLIIAAIFNMVWHKTWVKG